VTAGGNGWSNLENTVTSDQVPQDWMTYMLAVWRCWSPLKRLSMEMDQGGQAGFGKRIAAGVKRGLLASSPSYPHFTLNILSRRSDDSLSPRVG
jgi:hypothetical protein